MKATILVSSFCVLFQAAYARQFTSTFKLTDTVFTVGSIYMPRPFDLQVDSHGRELRPESQPFADSLADFILAHPGIILEIGSHTDQRGSDSSNLRISQLRANCIKTILMKKGVPDWQIPAVGYGETKPIQPEAAIQKLKTKEEEENAYQENRRTEFRILRTPRITFKLTDTAFTQGAYLFYPMRFALAKTTIDSSCYPFLDSLALLLIAHPELLVQVSNHTDTRFSPKSSSALSRRRAQSVVTYLVNKGVPNQQLIAKGYDDVQPIVPDTITYGAPGIEGQEQLHAINRRTEMRIIEVQ